jgi:hypothetical protein
MSQHVGMLDLSPGAVVVVDGVEWLVESFAPQYGHIQLHPGDGATMQTTVRALLSRSQRTRITWTRMNRIEDRWLPRARVMHSFPDVRFAART